jgi:hypothetical protein
MTVFGIVLVFFFAFMFMVGLDKRMKGTAPEAIDRVLVIIGIIIVGILIFGTGSIA